MANELEVDAGGLRVAATSSDVVAATELSGAQACSPASSQSSAAGVAAVNAALTRMRERQRELMRGQAGDLSVSSARYDSTDSDGHDAITVTV
ncbi:hypothetical protein [Mycolicibacterium neworleansense]|uniref:Uncharacterized protein n=1 Tax=Mycolicibacterium neworleansense TaxID=146018 RepID=A0A0H5RSN1_9MYCO|nr:hypothetical protein [Mycolicibacterium neworleansense]MCV7361589.1 hypothetical protein [Mycolicibacterium neworleansense]CRZ16943.1 hypothetical protein BN2156_03822 [Mycolicibacterium neworleansense]